ncbi:hypothetical protein WA026_007105 [Henosepilachna vigintioctopunctata]|uniref:L-type lectin-like domain-containing protein n=1 Tax=Henosepilachna vigintioctopunctata TaxID=420089 RepID=A0AAW1VCT6_9CUCU
MTIMHPKICGLFLTLAILKISYVKTQWNTKDFMKREHSLIKPYYGSGIDIPFWQFMGSTMITPNYIRLTADLQSKRGAIWNTIPLNARNWDLQVQFKVHGKGKNLFGDGFVVWYAKEVLQDGPVFGNKDFFQGLAIILDTYSNHNGPHNHQHPYISAMINNGSLHYDHDRDGTHTQLAGCEAKFRNLDYDTHISIKYEKDVLTVSTDIVNKAAWKQCLRVEGVILPTGYHIGLSATTGDLSDNHDIISVRLFELELPNEPISNEDRSKVLPSAKFFEPERERVEDVKSSGWSGVKLFFIMLLGGISLVAAVVVGIMFYQKREERSKKRFY